MCRLGRLLRIVISTCVFNALIWSSAVSDIIVCRYGREYRGAIAGRERLRAAPAAVSVVSILPDSSTLERPRLVRLARADIDYVVLEDGSDQRQVLDLSTLPILPAGDERLPDASGGPGD